MYQCHKYSTNLFMSKRNVNAFSSSSLAGTVEFEQWRQWRGSSRKSLDKRSSVPTINEDSDHQQCFDFSTICICVFILFLLFLFLYFYYLYSFTCSWLRLFLPRVFDSSSFSRMIDYYHSTSAAVLDIDDIDDDDDDDDGFCSK